MKKRLSAAAIGLVGALSLVPSAAADTTATVGAAAPSSGTLTGGCVTCVYMQRETDAASPSYVVPAVPAGSGPWTITSWAARGGTGAGSAAVEVWRPTGAVGEFRLIAIGPQQAFPTDVVTSHSVSIGVLPGDHLAVQSGPDTDFSPLYNTPQAGDVWISPPGSPTAGQTMGGVSSDFPIVATGSSARANVEATLTSVTPVAPAPAPAAPNKKKKCKKKHKRSAESAKKKKCKKHKKK